MAANWDGHRRPGEKLFWLYFAVALPLLVWIIIGYYTLKLGYVRDSLRWSFVEKCNYRYQEELKEVEKRRESMREIDSHFKNRIELYDVLVRCSFDWTICLFGIVESSTPPTSLKDMNKLVFIRIKKVKDSNCRHFLKKAIARKALAHLIVLTKRDIVSLCSSFFRSSSACTMESSENNVLTFLI